VRILKLPPNLITAAHGQIDGQVARPGPVGALRVEACIHGHDLLFAECGACKCVRRLGFEEIVLQVAGRAERVACAGCPDTLKYSQPVLQLSLKKNPLAANPASRNAEDCVAALDTVAVGLMSSV